MGRTFTGKITTEQLAAEIAIAFHNSDMFEGEVLPHLCGDAEEYLKLNHLRTGQVTETIKKDLAKVEFDEENLEWEDGEGYAGLGSITGFHTLPNGLTYLGVCCGGDWEQPLFYIVYYDGTKLRGYVPTEGNHWNTDTKAAYGNNQGGYGEDEDKNPDNENAKKRFGVDDIEELRDMDPAVLLADIEARITFYPDGRFIQPKTLKDLKLTKEEKYLMERTPEQAEQDEKDQAEREQAEREQIQAQMRSRIMRVPWTV